MKCSIWTLIETENFFSFSLQYFLKQKCVTFCYHRELLEDHDSGNRHEIWAKLYCPQNICGWCGYDDMAWVLLVSECEFCLHKEREACLKKLKNSWLIQSDEQIITILTNKCLNKRK